MLVDVPVDGLCAAGSGQTALVVPETRPDWDPLSKVLKVKGGRDRTEDAISSSIFRKVSKKLCQPRHVRGISVKLEEIAQHCERSTTVHVGTGQSVDSMDAQIVLLTVDGVLRRRMEMELESFVLLCDVRGLLTHLVVLSSFHGLHGAGGLAVHLNRGR